MTTLWRWLPLCLTYWPSCFCESKANAIPQCLTELQQRCEAQLNSHLLQIPFSAFSYSSGNIVVYDRVIFPLSRRLDLVLSPILGMNFIVQAIRGA